MGKITTRKLGRIRVTVELLEESKVMSALFQHFIPLRVDWDEVFMSGLVTYTGYSDFFSDVNEGCIPPLYEVIFQTVNGEPIFKEFKKAE